MSVVVVMVSSERQVRVAQRTRRVAVSQVRWLGCFLFFFEMGFILQSDMDYICLTFFYGSGIVHVRLEPPCSLARESAFF